MKLPSPVRRGSAVRGAGIALACLMPSLPQRARAVLLSYGVGWPLDKAGLQPFVVVPGDDAEPWQRTVVPFATSALSWTLVMTAVTTGVRRTPLPAPFAALLLGGAVAVADSALVDRGERARSRVPTESADPAEVDVTAP
jgi:hypothetical protein